MGITYNILDYIFPAYHIVWLMDLKVVEAKKHGILNHKSRTVKRVPTE